MREVSTPAPGPRLQWEIALLRQVALIVFIYTVVVGILNGTDMVDFSEKALLAHVHGGTLGWITTSVFAASLWLFTLDAPPSPAEARWARWLSIAAVVTIPAYVIAFLTTYGYARPIIGGTVVAVIVGFLLWILSRARHVQLTTPHLGVLAAVATSVTGGVLGVLWGIQLASGHLIFAKDGEGSHPATMVIGFLIPVGMALSEWCLAWPRPDRASRAGAVQVALPFTGGILVMLGILLNAKPLLSLSLPFEVAGVIILLVRMWPRLRRVSLLERTASRHAAMTMLFLTINIGVFVYLIGRYVDDFNLAPKGQVLTLDHTMFIGVMTNAILGLLLASTSARGREQWTWADHVVFWAVNIGLAGFMVGLFWDVTVLKRLFTPIMGTGILIAIALYTARLQQGREPAPLLAET